MVTVLTVVNLVLMLANSLIWYMAGRARAEADRSKMELTWMEGQSTWKK